MNTITNNFEIRVRYKETDKMGVVYSGNYFTYFEIGRTELMRSFGFAYCDIEKNGIMLPVIETYCRHRKPAHYDDLLIIETTGSLRRSFFRFEYKIYRKGFNEILSEGYTVHAFMKNEKVISAPEAISVLFKS